MDNIKKPSWDLTDIKVGQLVIICRLYGQKLHYELSSVTRTTPTLLECNNISYQFYKKNGDMRGNKHSFYHNRIYVQRYDEEWWQKHLADEQAEKERHELIVSLQYISWSKLPTRQLQAIKTIIDESTDITSDQLNTIIAILHEEKE